MQRRKSIAAIFILAVVMGFAPITAAQPPIRILSIDGGGVRGIVPATILMQLELELKKPVAEIFDYVAGTSIGGIIALALVTPDEDGRPAHKAADIVSLAFRDSWRIFNSSYSHWITSLGGLYGPKYQTDGLEYVLDYLMGDTQMSEALIPTLVTGYHIEGECGIEFSSQEASEFPEDRDCLMREVGLATAAAPTYFDAADVNFSWGTLHSIADGALYKQNPALIAYANAQQRYPDREIEVYSLGTGIISAEEMTAQLKGRGLYQWASPILKHMTLGGIDAEQTILAKFLNSPEKENYFRLNVHVAKAHQAMDNTAQENLKYLYEQAIKATKTSTFKRIVERLSDEK